MMTVYAYSIRRKCHEWANSDPTPYDRWWGIVSHYPLVKALTSYRHGWRKFVFWEWAIFQPHNIHWATRMAWGWLVAWLCPERAEQLRDKHRHWYEGRIFGYEKHREVTK